MFQQPFFSPESASITHQVAIGANNPVTRDDDGHIIFSIGIRNSSCGFSITRSPGQFKIADGFCKRYLHQFRPHSLLKCGAGLVDRKVELSALTIEIFNQLFNALDKHRWEIFLSAFCLLRFIMKTHFADKIIRATYFQDADR